MKILSAAIVVACVPLSAAAISSSPTLAASSLPTCIELARQSGWKASHDVGALAFMKKAFREGRCQTTDGKVYRGPRPKKK
jgi:hypothetical protein